MMNEFIKKYEKIKTIISKSNKTNKRNETNKKENNKCINKQVQNLFLKNTTNKEINKYKTLFLKNGNKQINKQV